MQQAWNTTGVERSRYVNGMFARIARWYDLMNSVMSFGMHRRWRRYAVSLANLHPGDEAVDVCCGTGDFCFDLQRAVGRNGRVVGVDFCAPMLKFAAKKAEARGTENVTLALGDALRLPLPSDRYAAATVGWGIRNVIDYKSAFREMTRVVRPGGKVICLDMAKPRLQPFKSVYNVYLYRLLPLLGSMSKNKEAYTYLPNSVTNFPDRERLAEMMTEAGLVNVRFIDLAFGVVCIHIGEKPCPAQPS